MNERLIDNLMTISGIVIVSLGLLAWCGHYNDSYYKTAQACIKQGMDWQTGGALASRCVKDSKEHK